MVGLHRIDLEMLPAYRADALLPLVGLALLLLVEGPDVQMPLAAEIGGLLMFTLLYTGLQRADAHSYMLLIVCRYIIIILKYYAQPSEECNSNG
jgi:hypothetical protein